MVVMGLVLLFAKVGWLYCWSRLFGSLRTLLTIRCFRSRRADCTEIVRQISFYCLREMISSFRSFHSGFYFL